ncbi:amino acid adenylation domain-containing protein [Actinokineospora iranica]|uniref:Amino acid adenylation domain-containing protein n=1 Tax=Actinokineospora iranica TaxID=1271860 RepID=A0A1G6IMF0_9PSEU|nr:amino acid adenylation domain-containing protein [Actinokineospora iranica]SDC07644.1 amino acid adenylation domain-containing protein [Actinokineospora iranica]
MHCQFRSPTTIHETFARIASELPDRQAVVTATGSTTYAELATRARHIAHDLIGRGVRPHDIVPVVARRSPDLLAAILGVLMAGGAYAVLDPRWPHPRTDRLLTAMRPPVVLADGAGSARLGQAGIKHIAFADLGQAAGPAEAPTADLPRVSPADRATVFWTSGSTGDPKAVLSPHQATTRLFVPESFMDFGERPVMILAAAAAWDAFSLELWGMLLRGGTAVLHEDDLLLPHSIRAYVTDFGATHLFLTPSLFDVIASGDIDCLAGLRALILGGDKPPPANCRKLLAAHPSVELYNGYGPVESCVFATVHRITMDDTHAAGGIPAGLPVPGTRVHIVADGVPVPPGESGEVAISGTGLASGYLNDPDQTAAAFRRVTVDGDAVMVYLTGDYGRLDETGVLHLTGRKDAQLKIAGHRIEPAEIESAVNALGSRRSVVMPIPDRTGAPRIILFAERPGADITEAEMRGRLSELLPAYMLPAKVHFVSTMPLLDNTKINKRELSARFGYTS